MAEDHLDPDTESDSGAGDPGASLPGDMLDSRAAEMADEVGALLRRAQVPRQLERHGEGDPPDESWPPLPGMEAF